MILTVRKYIAIDTELKRSSFLIFSWRRRVLTSDFAGTVVFKEARGHGPGSSQRSGSWQVTLLCSQFSGREFGLSLFLCLSFFLFLFGSCFSFHAKIQSIKIRKCREMDTGRAAISTLLFLSGQEENMG